MSKKTPAKRLTATKKKAPKGDLKKDMAGNAEIIQKAFGSKHKKAKDGDFEIVPKKKEIIVASPRPINELIREKISFEKGGGIEIDPSLSASECLSAISFFGEFETISNRAIGQLIIFAEGTYGDETYQAIVQATGMKPQYLANIASTVRNISSDVWNDSVPFTHHVIVAKLSDTQKKKLLKKAEKEELSVAALKREVAIVAPPRATKPRKAKASDDKTDQPTYSADTGSVDEPEMSQSAIEKDEKMLEKADAALLYVKSAAFGDLNAKARDAWKSLLMQFSDAYEKLLKA